MDFSNPYYGGEQHYPFIGIPPLTPSHQTNSAPSEEYSNRSPPERYDGFPNNEHFQNFDHYAQFNHHQNQPPFPGPPTPPTQNGQGPPSMNGAPPRQRSDEPHPPDSAHLPKTEPDQSARQGSNSDDDDMTPAQSRRKAQNRAAQRAFRERKEKHVKDLEAKLASLEAQQNLTASENEKLRRDLQKMSTENEILRATSGPSSNDPAGGGASHHAATPISTGPLGYNPTAFYTHLLAEHENKTPSHRIVQSEAGERLLAAGATWDFIVGHEMFKRGMVDVGDVSERLKNQAKCDGQGPVFEERAVLAAIVASAASGSDELL